MGFALVFGCFLVFSSVWAAAAVVVLALLYLR